MDLTTKESYESMYIKYQWGIRNSDLGGGVGCSKIEKGCFLAETFVKLAYFSRIIFESVGVLISGRILIHIHIFVIA